MQFYKCFGGGGFVFLRMAENNSIFAPVRKKMSKLSGKVCGMGALHICINNKTWKNEMPEFSAAGYAAAPGVRAAIVR